MPSGTVQGFAVGKAYGFIVHDSGGSDALSV
jgi:cold shock CspA family protein